MSLPEADVTARKPSEGGPVPDLDPGCPRLGAALDGLRMGVILSLVGLVTLVGIPLQWISLRLGLPSRRWVPVWYHRILLALIGVKVTVRGAPAQKRPLLLLANHASWLDICVLGSITPLFFVAKKEVSAWPVIGLLARFQRTVFVDRERRAATGAVNREIAQRLHEGDPVVLFAEGTSNDGNRVLPFRTALVGALREALAAKEDVAVQPLAVAYLRLQGIPMGRIHRPVAAWYGGMDLAPHLLEVLRQGALDVEVTFGHQMILDGGHDRKAVTRAAEDEVRALSVASLSGRPRTPMA